MSGHTPGPWGFYRMQGFGADYSVRTEDRAVAVVRHYGNPKVSEANARLIAAAPELLEACKRALEQTDPVARSGDYAILKEAIDKATSHASKA